jgi:hypothetical protein
MLKRQSERSGRRFKIGMRGCLRSIVRARVCSHSAERWGWSTAPVEGNHEFKIMNYRKVLRAVAWAMLAAAFIIHNSSFACAQTKTTVTDTIHGPDGSLPSGQIAISSKSTFTASDGTVVFAGTVATATVSNGSFSVALVPNSGSTPSGTSYKAIYKLSGVPYREETWVVPASATPVDLAAVRSASLSGLSAMVSPSQMPALSGDVNSSAGSTSASVVGLHWGSSGYTLSGAPSDGQCLTVSGFTITGGPCGSGSGQPQGSSGQVQINSGGSFAGASDLTYDTASGATKLIARDKGGQIFNVKAYGAKGDGTTDDTAAVQDAITAAAAAGGGVIYFPAGTYLLGTALSIPYVAGTPPLQKPLRFTGALMDTNGASWGHDLNGGSILNLTETSDTLGKFDSRGAGYLEIDHLSLTDTGSDSIPFIFVTNTTLHAHDLNFTSSQMQTSNVQDAIVLGGTNIADVGTANSDAPFAGYGTVIRDNFFNRVRHAVIGYSYANGVQIVDNTIGNGSGSSDVGDAPIRFVGYGTGSQAETGGYIAGNLIEETFYYYGIRLLYSNNFNIIGNNAYDGGAHTTADIYLDTQSTTNTISCGQTAVGVCVDPSSPGLSGDNVNVLSVVGGQVGNGFKLDSAQVPVNQCLWIGGMSGECVYGNGSNVYFRYQYDNSTDMTLSSLGWLGILNTQPYVPLDVNGAMRTRPVAFSSAGGCNSNTEGALEAFSDSTTATWGATIAGGGSNHVLGYCNGTNWTVAAK